MNKERAHTFNLGKAGRGEINIYDGNVTYIHEDISPASNLMGVGVLHQFTSEKVLDPDSASSRGKGFVVKLNPTYDADNLHDIYKNKVKVTTDSSNRITCIADRTNPNYKIDLIHETITGKTRLRKIVDTSGRAITFYYSGDLMTRIEYPDGQRTVLGYNASNLLRHIISPSKHGIYMLYSNNKVSTIKNTTFFNSITENGIVPNTLLSQADLPTPTSEDNIFTFVYNAQPWPFEDINLSTEVTESKTGIKKSYYFLPSLGFLHREELRISGTLTSIWEYEQSALSDDRTRLRTYYNTGKPDEFFNSRVINKDGNLTEDLTESYFDKIKDGVIEQRLYRQVRKVLEYSGKNPVKETITVIIKNSKTATTNLSQNEYITTYAYHTNGKLFKTNYPDGRIQKMFYDQSGNLIRRITYHINNPNEAIYEEANFDEHNCPVATFDEQSNRTDIFHKQNTCLVEKTIEPNCNLTEYQTDPQTDELIKKTSNQNQNSFSYTNRMLTKLSSNTTNYNFDYYSKTANFNSKQTIKINDVIFAEKEFCEVGGKDVITSSFVGGEKLITTIDGREKLEVDYFDKNNNKQKLVTNNYNPLNGRMLNTTDYVADAITTLVYDVNGNVILSENEQLKSTITNNNEGLIVSTKTLLKEQNITQVYSYSYDNFNRVNNITLPTLKPQQITYDNLGRVNKIAGPVEDQMFNYHTSRGRTTSLVSSIINNNDKLYYHYDNCGNISEVFENSKLIAKYTYDSLNRLIREDNSKFNITFTFEYDNSGNIVSKGVYDYSLEELTAGEEIEYNYIGDKLISFGNSSCEYDSLGRPTNYLGVTATWSHINRLRSLDDITFDYDAAGIRTQKTSANNTTKYHYFGDKLLAEKRTSDNNNTIIQYLYGLNGITGLIVNDETYYYRKNLQGDVTHILDSNGAVKAEYVYDAWGNHRCMLSDGILIYDSATGITAGYENHIGNINTIRYRSYYFDTETGFYYLQSRYYDPETGRFLNMDDISYLEPTRINGLNLFSYCGNNPVINIDPSGNAFFSMLLIGIFFVGATVAAASGTAAISKGLTEMANGGSFGDGVNNFFTGLSNDLNNAVTSVTQWFKTTGLYNNMVAPALVWFKNEILSPISNYLKDSQIAKVFGGLLKIVRPILSIGKYVGLAFLFSFTPWASAILWGLWASDVVLNADDYINKIDWLFNV